MPMHTIDCQFTGRAELAAAYLLVDGPHGAFVDNNTVHALPHLLAALAQAGLRTTEVDWIIPTHVHLDHAGGTAALLAACPAATVLCHPRAARHLVDPSRLEASARQVYGDAVFERLYGALQPIDPARVRVVQEGEEVRLGTRSLTVLHTRGHANHHLCVLDVAEGNVFTGDSFGLAYPGIGQGRFHFPSTSPTDFDPDAARASYRRLAATGAARAWLAHFGAVRDLAAGEQALGAILDDVEQLLADAAACDRAGTELEAFCFERMREILELAATRQGVTLTDAERKFLRFDARLNAQGLIHRLQTAGRSGLGGRGSDPPAPQDRH